MVPTAEDRVHVRRQEIKNWDGEIRGATAARHQQAGTFPSVVCNDCSSVVRVAAVEIRRVGRWNGY